MNKNPLYTIGHGSRKADEFLELLRKFKIEFLIDVRSQPFSKFNPQYNQNELKFLLEKNGIRYVFMGDAIGGRPKDISCYDKDGKVDYELIKTKDFFRFGLERLKTAYSKDLTVVIMCSESKPCECHRSKLIGTTLINEDVGLRHIDENGNLKNQATVMTEYTKGYNLTDLFGNEENLGSRKSYL